MSLTRMAARRAQPVPPENGQRPVKRRPWNLGKFIFPVVLVLAFGGLGIVGDGDKLYQNMVVAIGTQFNQDVADNSIAAGVRRTVWAKDGLGIPFPFIVGYGTPLNVYNKPGWKTPGLRSCRDRGRFDLHLGDDDRARRL